LILRVNADWLMFLALAALAKIPAEERARKSSSQSISIPALLRAQLIVAANNG
jgi:hypothetical protein